MGIEIKVNASARIRQLQRDNPWLTPDDIAGTTGYKLALVKAALGRRERDKPKSKAIEARGPLTAGEVAEKLRIPVGHARRVTG